MRFSFARFLGRSLGLSLLCLGTAVAQEREGERFLRLQTPDRDVSVQVSPGSVVGSDVRLVRDENVLRGRASGRSVFLRIGERSEELDGLVGSQPAWISWRQKEGTLRLEGNLLGGPLGLEIDSERLTGSAGPCTYDLEYQDEAYAGVRVCGTGDRQPVYVFLPPVPREQVSPMLALGLTVLLGM